MYGGIDMPFKGRTLKQELRNCCKLAGVKYNNVIGPSRQLRHVLVRQIFYSKMRVRKYTYRELGEVVGGRCHSTVICALNRFRDLKSVNDERLMTYLKLINK